MIQEGLDQDLLDDVATRWWAAWNAHDGVALASLCSEDLASYNPALGHDVYGRQALEQYVVQLEQAFPDLMFTPTEPPYASLTQPKAVVPWRFHGTHKGEFEPMKLAATGKVLEVDGADHWWFRGGEICRHRVIFDFAQVMRALAPAPDSS